MSMEHRECLTSRERVIRAINHEPVDRTPIDLGMHYSTGISAFAYWNLRQYLGLPVEEVEVIDPGQFLARVGTDVLQRFHCDCICFHPGYPNTALWNPRGSYQFRVPRRMLPERQPDNSWVASLGDGRLRMPEGGFFFDGNGFDPWDGEVSFLDAAGRNAERIYKETDLYTMYIGFGAYFSDNPDWLVNFMLEPEEADEQNRRLLEADLKEAGRVIDKMGRYVQGICINSDLGTQTAPFIRPSVHAERIAPLIKKFCDFVHRNSDCKIFMHSCGAMEPFIPALIQSGVDVLNPVQVSCGNMNPAGLKAKYGKDICFWGGGCDTQNVLGRGTPEEVGRNVKELMAAFAPGSGFVFNQVHNIMGNVPPENIVAMFDTAYEQSFEYGYKREQC
jgi:uroporphyrinogen decarboxylase